MQLNIPYYKTGPLRAMRKARSLFRQSGQSMVEYTIVLVFGVMVLTSGPAGDVILDLLATLNNQYQGYSYAISMSDLPQHDTINDYLNTNYDITPANIAAEVAGFLDLPTLGTFPTDLLPTSAADIIDGAGSFF